MRVFEFFVVFGYKGRGVFFVFYGWENEVAGDMGFVFRYIVIKY